LAGTVVNGMVGLNGGIPYYIGTAIGSVLPDIDHPNSFIGKRSFGLSYVINKLFGHRGATHSLLSLGIIGGISFSLLPLQPAAGLVVGVAGHLLGDFFSKTGIPILHPFRKEKYGIPLYKTGGLAEGIILIVSGILLGLTLL